MENENIGMDPLPEETPGANNINDLRAAVMDLNNLPDPVEVDEEPKPEEESHAAEPLQEEMDVRAEVKPKRRRKGNDFGSRINRMSRENNLLKQQLTQANAILREQHAYAQAEKRAALENAEINYQHALNTDLQLAKQVLITAEEEGDISAKVAAQEKIAEIKAKMAAVDIEKRQAYASLQEQAPYIPDPTLNMPYEEDIAGAELNEAYTDWLDGNEWYDKKSPFYNARLAQEADQIAESLMSQLTLSKQQEYIGTPEFYETVTKVLHKRHGIANEPAPQRRPSMSQPTSRAPVAPSGNYQSTNQSMYNHSDGRNYSRPLYLTKEQAEMAAKFAPYIKGQDPKTVKKIWAMLANKE